MLTSGELQQLLQQRGTPDLRDVPEAPLDSLLSSVDEQGKLFGVPGASGGAQLSCSLAAACRVLSSTYCCTSVLRLANVVTDSNNSLVSRPSVLAAVVPAQTYCSSTMLSGPLFHPCAPSIANLDQHSCSGCHCLTHTWTHAASHHMLLCTATHWALASCSQRAAAHLSPLAPSTEATSHGPPGPPAQGILSPALLCRRLPGQLTHHVQCHPPAAVPDKTPRLSCPAGGYLEFIFRTAARQLFGRELPHGPLAFKQLRNADFQEVSLEVEGKPALRFAAAYGFRNIQTLMRKIKRRACEYHFVEVMACPSGCLNGGGQVKAGQSQTSKQLLDELDTKYHHQDVILRHPADNPIVPLLYKQWVQGAVHSPAAQELLHTGYHRRERTMSSTVGDW